MSAIDSLLLKSESFLQLKEAVDKNNLPAGALGLTNIHKANIISSLCTLFECRGLVVMPDEASATKLCEDLRVFGKNALLYPERDFSFNGAEIRSHEYEQKRIKVLAGLSDGSIDVAVCSAAAAIQRTIPPEELKKYSLTIKKGEEISLENIVNTLLACGYTRYDMVEGVGQFSVRGGILDLFSPDDEQPTRIEFWGDTVESMSKFDIATQRRSNSIDSLCIMPSTEIVFTDDERLKQKISEFSASVKGKGSRAVKEHLEKDIERLESGIKLNNEDKYLSLAYERECTVFDYLDKNCLCFICESSSVKEKVQNANKLMNEEIKALLKEGVLCNGLDKYCLTTAELFRHYEKLPTVFLDNFARGSFDVPVKQLVSFTASPLPAWNGRLDVLTEDLAPVLKRKSKVVVFAGTEKNAKQLAEDLESEDIPAIYLAVTPKEIATGRVCVLPGALSSGFSYPGEGIYVFSYGRAAALATKKQRRARFKKGQGIHSLDELKTGDYIVHRMYGIGIFDGIKKLESGKIVKDYIKIKYAKGDILYLPVTQLDLVSKYIGPHDDSGKTVKLNRIGTGDWEKTKKKVRSAVKDMADELIALYSKRLHSKGFAFSEDIDMQSDFERRFAYDETPDQLRAADEIKGDMQKPYPMDRLLCGDVGFGKTEVALRAAFKCVADGKQCAILVPTTILALQHYKTIEARFDGFPVEVEMLSRFRTATEQTKIKKALQNGTVDILVGTHKLISKDVNFKDLGLLIIDEEQRFGVAQKEKLKEKFPYVDVLTLSATPIPRTLNMAMTGIRDMSVIEEAPQDRHPVQTYVLEHDMGVLCEAMEKELRRGGQVYYLFNNVEKIEEKAAEIKSLLPEAKVETAHGKMAEEELSGKWRALLEGQIDILVCTTIIETGVDVPNVNTLIIENADRMGLSQLHQIRGRVGRSSRRASAYFTFRRGKELTEIAQKRLEAIREYTEFGSGFKIAMRDLEIRGAGSILGSAQHGHLEAVGYDMYLELLGEAVSEEKGDTAPVRKKECLIDMQIDAYIPDEYIGSIPQRLEIYRRIADIMTEEDVTDVKDELRDRYGEIPQAVQGLIDISLLRNTATGAGIYEIGQKGDRIILYMNEIPTTLVLNLSAVLRGRIGVSDFGKKYISVRILPDEEPLQALKEVFGYIGKS